MPVQKKLTPNDVAVLKALVDWTDTSPYPPTVRDLGRRAELEYSSVNCALQRLQRRGLIDRTPGVSRSLRPLAGARAALKRIYGLR